MFDAATGKFLLFGGQYTTGNYHEFVQPIGDTWTWDGSSWTQVSGSRAPVSRTQPSAVYDPVHGVVLLYGGMSATSSLGETWTWNGNAWALQSPSQAPPSCCDSHPMAWDAKHGVAIQFVYVGTGPSSQWEQTWTWDGSTWTRLPAPGSPPGPPCVQTCIGYNPANNSAVVFGHVGLFGQAGGTPTTWTFDGTAWSQTATNSGSASNDFSLVQDDANSDVVLFGENGDTWTWDGSKWTAQNPVHSPSARRGAAMTYDSVHHVVVLFGGASGTAAALQEHNDIWTWNGSDWTHVTGS